MHTNPHFIANPCFSFACAAAQHGSDNNSRLKSSDEIVSCYKDPAERVLFHDVEMKGRIREEDVGFRNQLRHQLTRLCVMTEADTLARREGHQVFSFLPDLVFSQFFWSVALHGRFAASAIISLTISLAGLTCFTKPTPRPAARHISSKSPRVSGVGKTAENFGIE